MQGLGKMEFSFRLPLHRAQDAKKEERQLRKVRLLIICLGVKSVDCPTRPTTSQAVRETSDPGQDHRRSTTNA